MLHYLLDFRFVAVFAFCALLSVLSAYAGAQRYTRQLREYNAVSENNRRAFQEKSIDQGRLYDLYWYGYQWNRRPEVLSLLVFGLSGDMGREAYIGYQNAPVFEAGVFETDPIHALFEVLDLAFVAGVVMSLCALMFTFDAVCGEKEGGTLRLYASFPVSRSTLALAKLAGAALAVLIPVLFCFLLASAALALSPDTGLQAGDWARIACLAGLYALYLTAFAAFGLLVSGLTHRRMTAFLGLLGLWTAWVFVVPDLAVTVARRLIPVTSVYAQQRQVIEARWEIKTNMVREWSECQRRYRPEDWDALSGAQRLGLRAEVEARWDAAYFSRVGGLQKARWNRMREQGRLAGALASISPFSAANLVSMDLARTGMPQQERIEDALSAYVVYLAQYVHQKRRAYADMYRGVNLTDFTRFSYRDAEGVGECLSRNLFPILNLALLALLGFAGAYVAILRYDVR